MAIVSQHTLFDAYLNEVNAEHPELHASDTVEALKWALRHDKPIIENYDDTEMVYFVTTEGIQVFYDKRNPVGRPTEIILRAVRARPDLC